MKKILNILSKKEICKSFMGKSLNNEYIFYVLKWKCCFVDSYTLTGGVEDFEDGN